MCLFLVVSHTHIQIFSPTRIGSARHVSSYNATHLSAVSPTRQQRQVFNKSSATEWILTYQIRRKHGGLLHHLDTFKMTGFCSISLSLWNGLKIASGTHVCMRKCACVHEHVCVRKVGRMRVGEKWTFTEHLCTCITCQVFLYVISLKTYKT